MQKFKSEKFRKYESGSGSRNKKPLNDEPTAILKQKLKQQYT